MLLCVKTVPFHHNHTTVPHLTSLSITYIWRTFEWVAVFKVSAVSRHIFMRILFFQAEYFRYLSQNIAMNILRLQRITFPFRMHSETESTASFYDTHAEREIFPHFKLTSFRVIDKLVCSLHAWHMGLHSSAQLQRLRREHGFESRWSPEYSFQANICSCLNCDYNCDDHISISSVLFPQFNLTSFHAEIFISMKHKVIVNFFLFHGVPLPFRIRKKFNTSWLKT